MAVLGATSLTGCTSIPSFIGSGSKMVFRMATTPVSWTKDTSVNAGTLRVINGSVSPGGSLIWDQVFTTRSIFSGTNTAAVQDNATINQTTVTITVDQNNFLTPQTTSANALDANTLRSHAHVVLEPQQTLNYAPGAQNMFNAKTSANMSPAGGGQQHSHAINSNHSHPFPAITGATHGHPVTKSGHLHGLNPVNVNFNLTYVDMIVASKDA